MKVRIISDGNPFHTEIWDVEKGKRINNVMSARWEQRGPEKLPEIHLVLLDTDVHLTADASTSFKTTKGLITLLFNRLLRRIWIKK